MKPNVINIPVQQLDCRQFSAIVMANSDNNILIDCELGVVKAQVAFSCLVVPQVGDTVLVNESAKDLHILSILQRPEQQDMTLNYPASVKMTAAKGQFNISSSESINLVSASNTQISAPQIVMNSSNMALNTGKLMAKIQHLESHSKTLKIYTGMLSMVAQQISQKTDVMMRWVESVETLNIGNLIQKIRHNYTTHSDQAVITARKDMRIDGERIHMG